MAERASFSRWTILKSRIIIREIKPEGISIKKKDFCFCGSGESYLECHPQIRENTAMAQLFDVFRLIDEDVRSASAAPACEKGCARCCHDYFEVSAPEFFAIIMYIQKKSTGLFSARIRNIGAARKAAQKMRAFFPRYKNDSTLSGQRMYAHPCVFLDNRKGLCRIYEVRPLLCRLYGYYSEFGNCALAKSQLSFINPETEKGASQFLGDTVIGNTERPPIAAPLVYWLGGRSPITDRQDFKNLFLTANNEGIEKYMRFALELDFDKWFSF